MSLYQTRLAALALSLPVRLRLNELGPLLALAVVGFGGWGFVTIASEVRDGDTLSFDRTLLLALRQPGNLADPIGPSWLEEVARDFTGLGGHAILGFVTLATIAYMVMTGRRHAAWLVAVAIGGAMLASALLKIGFDRPRPDLVPHGARVYTASFPSGHAMLSTATYLTLGALLARLHAGRPVKLFFLTTALLLAILIGCSRVYLGVHWPSDVLGGWCMGGAWAALCWYGALLLQRRGKVETEAVAAQPVTAVVATPQA